VTTGQVTGKDVPQKELRGGRTSSKERVDLEEAYLQMARTLALAVEAREPHAHGHSERVALLATEIAIELDCPGELIREIQIAARLHDIGKIAIPDHVLFKPGRLTPAEFSEIKRHPTVAVEILRCLDHFHDIIPLIESHHEWYSGEGYPNKLKGEEIPLGARILAVADTRKRPRSSGMRLVGSGMRGLWTLSSGSWSGSPRCCRRYWLKRSPVLKHSLYRASPARTFAA